MRKEQFKDQARAVWCSMVWHGVRCSVVSCGVVSCNVVWCERKCGKSNLRIKHVRFPFRLLLFGTANDDYRLTMSKGENETDRGRERKERKKKKSNVKKRR